MPNITELPLTSGATAAPGWAYVPSNIYVDPSKAPLNPTTSRKHRAARNGPAFTNNDTLSLRQQSRLQQRLALLSQDNDPKKEVPIPGKGGRVQGKTTATKRILLSAKTIKNHLDDEEAMLAQAQGQNLPHGTTAPVPGGALGRQGRRGGGRSITSLPQSPAPATPSGEQSSRASEAPTAHKPASPSVFPPVLTAPTEAELSALLSAPPLSYSAARAGPPGPNAPPQRRFCDICGYWGRIRCMRCGERVCGLECKQTHEQGRCVAFI